MGINYIGAEHKRSLDFASAVVKVDNMFQSSINDITTLKDQVANNRNNIIITRKDYDIIYEQLQLIFFELGRIKQQLDN